MINMSYCRMENTYLALQEAFSSWEGEYFEDLDEGRPTMALAPLSEREEEYRQKLLRLCEEIVGVYGGE